jgi:transcriptional regulator with GAF, ATPase, and Fis domain
MADQPLGLQPRVVEWSEGRFTGAPQRRDGGFESADRGTIFLDEVGKLPAEMQMALLHIL